MAAHFPTGRSGFDSVCRLPVTAFVAASRPCTLLYRSGLLGRDVHTRRPDDGISVGFSRRAIVRQPPTDRRTPAKIVPKSSAFAEGAISPKRSESSVLSPPRGVGSGFWTLRAIGRLAAPLYTGKRKTTAYAWTVFVVVMALVSTLYAVGMSFILRMFWNSLSSKDSELFQKLLRSYSFAVVIGPVVVSFFDWAKARLALAWRNALTSSLVEEFLRPSKLSYYAITQALVPGVDNADQRLSDDIRLFSERAVRFICVLSVAVFDLAVFSAVLYKLYPPLFGLLFAYAVGGTAVIALYGRSLVGLNAAQVSREGNFRFSLLRVRENSESIAFYGGEKLEKREVFSRLGALVDNAMRLLGMNRNVTFLATSHRYWIQVVPNFIMAPVYFSGKISMGTISQVLYSFNHVLSSTGLIVTEFVALSEFAAGVRRLTQLSEAIRKDIVHESDGTLGIDFQIAGPGAAPRIAVQNLCLQTPNQGFRQPLVQNLNFTVEPGQRLLVNGQSGIGKTSLLRALAGLWKSGAGTVEKPCHSDTLFLSQKPFIMLGTLRENVLYPLMNEEAGTVSDDEILHALSKVNLNSLTLRIGGLGASGEEIDRRLSVGEKQRLAFARVALNKPKFVVLDEATSALDEDNEREMYKLIQELGATCISVGNRATLLPFHDTVLTLIDDGNWHLSPR